MRAVFQLPASMTSVVGKRYCRIKVIGNTVSQPQHLSVYSTGSSLSSRWSIIFWMSPQ